MNAENRREVVVRLTGAVAHLYGMGIAYSVTTLRRFPVQHRHCSR